MNLKEEKLMVLDRIVATIKEIVVSDENFTTHDMLKILMHECKKLIVSDF